MFSWYFCVYKRVCLCLCIYMCFLWFFFDSFSFICLFVCLFLIFHVPDFIWYYIIIIILDAYLNSNERKKEFGEFGLAGKWGGSWKSCQRGTIIRTYCMKNIFSIFKKEEIKKLMSKHVNLQFYNAWWHFMGWKCHTS